MGKIKSRFLRVLLAVVGIIGLIVLAVVAWEPLSVCAVLAGCFWILRKFWRFLDRKLHLMEWLGRGLRKTKGLARPLKWLLILLLACAAVCVFLASTPVSVICLVCAVAYWLGSALWKRWKPRRKDGFHLRNLSLRVSYVAYVVVAMVTATLTCSLIINMVDAQRQEMYSFYYDQAEHYDVPSGGRLMSEETDGNVIQFRIVNAVGKTVEEFNVDSSRYQVTFGYWTNRSYETLVDVEWYDGYNVVNVEPKYSDEDRWLDRILGILQVLCIPVVYVSAIALCAVLFFQKKLQEPIAILTDAASKIAENSLDFHVSYEPRDEMGQLCDSFEKMREALEKNNAEMWRQMEERRRMNAAFSHDLRTPLTVLKGHAELLKSEIPDEQTSREELLGEINAMSAHINRLENYVVAMSRLHRLEDMEIHAEDVPVAIFIQNLRESAEILCGNKALGFAASSEMYWYVDAEVVAQVFENLMSNAVRYARSWVKVCFEARKEILTLTVIDDGPGFSDQGLKKATEPFFRAETGGDHLGLGLNICRILCERHDGGVRVANHPEGGSMVTAWFSMKRI